MNARGPFGFFVAALFQIPWDQTNAKHNVQAGAARRRRPGVPIPSGEPSRARRRVRGRTPRWARPGTPVDAPLVVPFGPLGARRGALRAAADDRTTRQKRIGSSRSPYDTPPLSLTKPSLASKPTRPRSSSFSRRSRRKRPASAPSTRRWSYVSVRFMIGRIAITSSPSSSWTTQGRLTTA